MPHTVRQQLIAGHGMQWPEVVCTMVIFRDDCAD